MPRCCYQSELFRQRIWTKRLILSTTNITLFTNGSRSLIIFSFHHLRGVVPTRAHYYPSLPCFALTLDRTWDRWRSRLCCRAIDYHNIISRRLRRLKIALARRFLGRCYTLINKSIYGLCSEQLNVYTRRTRCSSSTAVSRMASCFVAGSMNVYMAGFLRSIRVHMSTTIYFEVQACKVEYRARKLGDNSRTYT